MIFRLHKVTAVTQPPDNTNQTSTFSYYLLTTDKVLINTINMQAFFSVIVVYIVNRPCECSYPVDTVEMVLTPSVCLFLFRRKIVVEIPFVFIWRCAVQGGLVVFCAH